MTTPGRSLFLRDRKYCAVLDSTFTFRDQVVARCQLQIVGKWQVCGPNRQAMIHYSSTLRLQFMTRHRMG